MLTLTSLLQDYPPLYCLYEIKFSLKSP